MRQVKQEFDAYRYGYDDNLLKAFDKHKVLFIHIPKTAGISVRDSLFQTHGFSKHVKAQTYKYYLGKTTFNSYFKFAFVRNPWARTLSAYNFLKKGGINEVDKNWSDAVLSQYDSFEDFVMNGLHTEEVINWTHFIPQYKWLCDHKNRNLMDFTGRLESIEADYEYIRERTGIGLPLKHKNKGKTIESYRNFYTETMQNKVVELYKLDIELFNYTF
jgi:hypothetical protein